MFLVGRLLGAPSQVQLPSCLCILCCPTQAITHMSGCPIHCVSDSSCPAAAAVLHKHHFCGMRGICLHFSPRRIECPKNLHGNITKLSPLGHGSRSALPAQIGPSAISSQKPLHSTEPPGTMSWEEGSTRTTRHHALGGREHKIQVLVQSLGTGACPCHTAGVNRAQEQGGTELCLAGQFAVHVPVGLTAECSCTGTTAAGVINCLLSLWSGVTASCSRDASN